MFSQIRILFILVIAATTLSACGVFDSSDAIPEQPPEETAEVTLQADISNEEHNIISIRIDEIRLAPGAADYNIPLDTVWLIPLNTEQDVSARMQYIEDEQNIVITKDESYSPTSPWFISIEREDLDGENFGLWFIVANTDSNDSLVTQETFENLILDVGIVVTSTAVGSILTAATPGVPDEVPAQTIAISRGRSILATVGVLGSQFMRYVNNNRSNLASGLTEQQLERLVDGSKGIDNVEFFSEVYVIIPSSDDYYLNNQISAITADGSLEIVFSIFDTNNVTGSGLNNEFVAEVIRRDIFPPSECNPEQPSQLQAGMHARINEDQQNALESIFTQDLEFTLFKNDLVTTVFPYCNQNEELLWWRVRSEDGEYGYVPESRGTRVVMEPVIDE